MDYILQLRQYIGHRPLLVIGAGALLLDEQNRLLLLKRSDNECWGIPGGSIEPGEDLESAAKREAWEEVNLEVGEMSLFGCSQVPSFITSTPMAMKFIMSALCIYRVIGAARSS